MSKISGRFESPRAEILRQQIEAEDSITKLHHLINTYLTERIKQGQKILANIDDKDLDLELVIEQFLGDLQLAKEQIRRTIVRSDYYAEHFDCTNHTKF